VTLQPDRHHPVKPGESTESSQRSVGDVSRPGGPVQQPTDRQAARDVDEVVVPVAKTARKLYQRPRGTTQVHPG